MTGGPKPITMEPCPGGGRRRAGVASPYCWSGSPALWLKLVVVLAGCLRVTPQTQHHTRHQPALGKFGLMDDLIFKSWMTVCLLDTDKIYYTSPDSSFSDGGNSFTGAYHIGSGVNFLTCRM